MKGVLIPKYEIKRFLYERQAASYCNISLAEFRRDCPVSPRQRPGKRPDWDVAKLDDWCDNWGAKKNSGVEQALALLN